MFCCTKLSAGLAAAAKATGGEKMIATSMTTDETTLTAQSGAIRYEYDVMKFSYNSCAKLYPQNGKRVERGSVPLAALSPDTSAAYPKFASAWAMLRANFGFKATLAIY